MRNLINKKLNMIQLRNPYTLTTTIIIFAGLIIFFINCIKLWPFTIDDSFITFRYSKNLVNGIGPTFNSTLPRAEGYTSFLWMIIMVLPHIVNFGVVSFSKIFGIFCTIGILWFIWLFIKKEDQENPQVSQIAAGLVIFFYLILPETAVHTLSGMETALFSFLLIMFAWFSYSAIKGSISSLSKFPIIGLAVGLTRPESNLVILVIFLVVLFLIKEKKKFLKKLAIYYFIPGLIYFIWRWSYYGLLLPLPFYIKADAGNLPGLDYVYSFINFTMTSLLILFATGILGNRKKILITNLIVFLYLTIFIFVTPIMGFDYRFLYPVLPLILVISGLGLIFLLKIPLVNTIWTIKSLGVIWISIVFIFIFSWNNVFRSNSIISKKLDYSHGLSVNHIEIGQFLSTIDDENSQKTLVVTDAGALPYYSGWRTIDAIGLNDPIIALNETEQLRYIFNDKPDILIITSNHLKEFVSDSEYYRNLYQTAIDQGMEVISKNPIYQGDSMWVLGFPDSEVYFQFREWIDKNQ